MGFCGLLAFLPLAAVVGFVANDAGAETGLGGAGATPEGVALGTVPAEGGAIFSAKVATEPVALNASTQQKCR